MSHLRRSTATALIICVLALPAVASPYRDDPFETIKNRISRAIKAIARVFVPTTNDEPQPPKP